MTGRCKDCQWAGKWVDATEWLPIRADCNNPKLRPVRDEDLEVDGLYPNQDEYRPGVDPEFGCIHFEPKEPKA